MDPKQIAQRSVHNNISSLVALSHRIHGHPEIAFEEEQASLWLGELLSQKKFIVTRGICELPTALMARCGNGPLNIVFCAEYDALPGMGHACGHNIIAAAAAGAALALADLVDDLGITITVMGTPAEEIGNGGGKILLLERGAFAQVHAAMMVHPAPFDSTRTRYLAASSYKIEYTGKSTHASAAAEFGVNAANALTVAQVAIGLLRQHIAPSDKIHGIITQGGAAPNVIPDHTAAEYFLRARTRNELQKLVERVTACFKAGAVATGCSLRVIKGDKPYAEMRQDEELMLLYRQNAESLGREFPELGSDLDYGWASTDMGNVSCEIPSIHPCIGIGSWPAVNHQPEFTACCISPRADKAVEDGALIMARTAIDIALNRVLRKRLLLSRPERSVPASVNN